MNSAYSLVGLAYDGAFRLLFESDANDVGGSEVFSSLDVNSAYSLVGLAYEANPPQPSPVTLPPTVLLLVPALVLLRRRQSPVKALRNRK